MNISKLRRKSQSKHASGGDSRKMLLLAYMYAASTTFGREMAVKGMIRQKRANGRRTPYFREASYEWKRIGVLQ